MTWSLFIPGTPLARAEKRVTFRTKGGKVINKLADKAPQAAYKTYVKEFIASRLPERMLDGPLALTIWVYRDRPKSLAKRVLLPTTKPDASNYQKLIEDCLTGLVIRDDSLIVSVKTEKRFCDPAHPLVPQKPGVWIEVRELQQTRASHLDFGLIGGPR